MEERMDYFRAVETAIYEESGFQVPHQRCMLLLVLSWSTVQLISASSCSL